MEKYGEADQTSGIESFEIKRHSIVIKFKDSGTYVYSFQRPGREKTLKMMELARVGKGLNTYINKEVRENYERRLE